MSDGFASARNPSGLHIFEYWALAAALKEFANSTLIFAHALSGGHRPVRATEWTPNRRPILASRKSNFSRKRTVPIRDLASGVFQQVRGHGGFGVRDAFDLRFAVGHRQQSPNAPGYSVFRHRWIGEPAQLLQGGLPVLDAQLAGRGKMVGHTGTQDLQRTLDASGRRHRGAGRAPQIGVVEVR